MHRPVAPVRAMEVVPRQQRKQHQLIIEAFIHVHRLSHPESLKGQCCRIHCVSARTWRQEKNSAWPHSESAGLAAMGTHSGCVSGQSQGRGRVCTPALPPPGLSAICRRFCLKFSIPTGRGQVYTGPGPPGEDVHRVGRENDPAAPSELSISVPPMLLGERGHSRGRARQCLSSHDPQQPRPKAFSCQTPATVTV